MTQAKHALWLLASLKAEAERLAKAEGTTLNQFINVAVAEKIAALRTADFFRERAGRGMCPGRWRCSMVLAATRRRGRGMSWRGEGQTVVTLAVKVGPLSCISSEAEPKDTEKRRLLGCQPVGWSFTNPAGDHGFFEGCQLVEAHR